MTATTIKDPQSFLRVSIFLNFHFSIKTQPILKGSVIMFSGILLEMEHRKLKNRADKLREKLAIQGLTNELLVEMQKLQRDVNDLEERTNDELERLGLNK